MELKSFQSDYIAGMKIEETFGRYSMLCKCGATCRFGIEQASNERHAHDCYELYIIISGTGRFIHGGEEYVINGGDIVIADKDAPHEFQSIGMQEMNLLYLFVNLSVNDSYSPAKTVEDSLIQGFLAGHDIVAPRKNHILSYLDFIQSYHSGKTGRYFGTYQALKNLILESIAALSRNTALLNTQTVSQNPFERALDYIDAHLHKKIAIQDLVSVTHISQRNLEYLFRRNVNQTIVGYINEKKVDRACHYLKLNFNITDTARLVGVSDCVQFSRLFKKYKGIPPKEFKRLHARANMGIGRRV